MEGSVSPDSASRSPKEVITPPREEDKGNMEKLVEQLRDAVKSEEKPEKITAVLDFIVDTCETSIKESTELSVEEVFLPLLRHESRKVITNTAKTIANIAVTDAGRAKCTRPSLIKALLELLQDDRPDVLTQVCRAVANICYDNECGNRRVEEAGGLKAILNTYKRSVAMGSEEGASLLRNVLAGLLLNFLNDNAALIKEALKQGIVPILTGGLEADFRCSGEAAMHSALFVLGILNDAGLSFLDEPLVKLLVEILASDVTLDLSELCLELLHGQAEDEAVKLHLAKAGACELVLLLLEKYGRFCTDETTKSVLKLACNLIVLVLIGDESMVMLYKSGEGPVYKKLVAWLDSADRELRTLAILAIGNFAQNDAHCESMVAQGIHLTLLRLLRGQAEPSDAADIQYQHALLSAVKNLAIAPANRRPILDAGLIDALCPMLEAPFLVLFKLLGALRIVIHGQQEAALELGMRPGIIRKLTEWCDVEGHPGVHWEANRLVTSLIIYGRSKEIAELMFAHQAMRHLIKMLSAPHHLMRHDAMLALNILAGFDADRLAADLRDGGFFELLPELMKDVDKIAELATLLCTTLKVL